MIIDPIGRSTEDVEMLQRVPTRQKTGWKGPREVKGGDEQGVGEVGEGAGEVEGEGDEEKEEGEDKRIDSRVEGTFDGYDPSFDIDIDKIMGNLNSEMDQITLAKNDEEAQIKKRLGGSELEKANVPLFRPVSEIVVDESQFWTSDSYKEELVAEVREDLTRGLKIKVEVEAVASYTELKSLLHSIFHEEEVKRNCMLVSLAGGGSPPSKAAAKKRDEGGGKDESVEGEDEGEEEEKEAGASYDYRGVPKVLFTKLDANFIRAEMMLTPCN